jgi:hypothetical protein
MHSVGYYIENRKMTFIPFGTKQQAVVNHYSSQIIEVFNTFYEWNRKVFNNGLVECIKMFQFGISHMFMMIKCRRLSECKGFKYFFLFLIKNLKSHLFLESTGFY